MHHLPSPHIILNLEQLKIQTNLYLKVVSNGHIVGALEVKRHIRRVDIVNAVLLARTVPEGAMHRFALLGRTCVVWKKRCGMNSR